MSTAKSVAAATKTKQYQALIAAGLNDVTTERQLENGSIAFTGKFKVGRSTVKPSYVVTANGAVISNEFVARRVYGSTVGQTYRQGLEAVAEILEKRLAA